MNWPEALPEWHSVTAVLAGEPAPPWVRVLATWIRDTIGAPLPPLGRVGALCPFVPRALELGSLFACEGVAENQDAIASAVEGARRGFADTFALEGEADNLKAVAVGFPKLARAKWLSLKAVRTLVKPDFIADGFTLSEFHDDSDDRSVRNSVVRIGGSPVACIVIRRLQIHDEIFLRSQPELYPIFCAQMKARRRDG